MSKIAVRVIDAYVFKKDQNGLKYLVLKRAPEKMYGGIWQCVTGKIEKGEVLNISQIAGIMGAKKTPELIPLCHPLNLSSIKVKLTCNNKNNSIDVTAICKVFGKTGVEMEALTAVSIACLTVYDMCKAVDREMKISDIQLNYKSGGKSGVFKNKVK